MRLRKSSHIIRLIILTVVIYAVVTIVSLQPKIQETRAQAASLAAEVSALRWETEQLRQALADLGSDASVLRIARERLNLVLDGEQIIIDTSK